MAWKVKNEMPIGSGIAGAAGSGCKPSAPTASPASCHRNVPYL